MESYLLDCRNAETRVAYRSAAKLSKRFERQESDPLNDTKQHEVLSSCIFVSIRGSFLTVTLKARRDQKALCKFGGFSIQSDWSNMRFSKSMQYAVIIEKGERNYSAYLPDLPGCIATGKTIEEVKQSMHEAVELHLRGMREDGLPIPEPSLVEYVEAA